MKIIQCKELLLGIDFATPYRIKFDVKESIIAYQTSILNHLRDTFGEGTLTNNDYEGPGWHLHFSHRDITIVLDCKEKVQAICAYFDWPCEIEVEPTYLEHQLQNVLMPLFARKITSKLIARIRQEVANVLHLSWYQVQFNVQDSSIAFEHLGKHRHFNWN